MIHLMKLHLLIKYVKYHNLFHLGIYCLTVLLVNLIIGPSNGIADCEDIWSERYGDNYKTRFESELRSYALEKKEQETYAEYIIRKDQCDYLDRLVKKGLDLSQAGLDEQLAKLDIPTVEARRPLVPVIELQDQVRLDQPLKDFIVVDRAYSPQAYLEDHPIIKAYLTYANSGQANNISLYAFVEMNAALLYPHSTDYLLGGFDRYWIIVAETNKIEIQFYKNFVHDVLYRVKVIEMKELLTNENVESLYNDLKVFVNLRYPKYPI